VGHGGRPWLGGGGGRRRAEKCGVVAPDTRVEVS
jgi:hypothetical protein